MKKIILLAAAVLGFTAMQAQTALEGNKFSDNWSIGLNGTAVTPLTHHAFWKNMRGGVALDINKQISPIFGLTIEGSAYFNPSEGAFQNPNHLNTIVDATNVSLLGRFNIMNLFGGYKGAPRAFEMEAVYGGGWLHTFGNKENALLGAVTNTFTTKAGINFNFNLGESKAWTVSVKPAVIWNMNDRGTEDQPKLSPVRYNGNNASVELAAGITYHFTGSNGAHHFTLVNAYNQAEIDALNAKINGLRNDLDAKNNELNDANARANKLQNDLNDCLNRKPEVKEVVNQNAIPETLVTFAQGKSVIAASQLPNVERVATYLKNHKNAKVDIKGYASPEGSKEINEKIANARANAVKDVLVKKYKIAANRITAAGQGVGDMFSEPDWNRVSICAIDDAK